MVIKEPSEIIFLTRANVAHITEDQAKYLQLLSLEAVKLRDIAWVQSYKNEKLAHGCICLMNDGQFKTFLQSADFVKRSACAVVGRRAKLGLAPLNVPWAIE